MAPPSPTCQRGLASLQTLVRGHGLRCRGTGCGVDRLLRFVWDVRRRSRLHGRGQSARRASLERIVPRRERSTAPAKMGRVGRALLIDALTSRFGIGSARGYMERQRARLAAATRVGAVACASRCGHVAGGHGTVVDLTLLPCSHAYGGSFGDLGVEEACSLCGGAEPLLRSPAVEAAQRAAVDDDSSSGGGVRQRARATDASQHVRHLCGESCCLQGPNRARDALARSGLSARVPPHDTGTLWMCLSLVVMESLDSLGFNFGLPQLDDWLLVNMVLAAAPERTAMQDVAG